jgi:K+-sensing histidine kinase KdpD
VIIPIFFHTTRYFFISALVSFIFSGAVAYSIVRHRLMGIRMVVARSISYSVLVLALGIICSSGLFLVEVFTPSELIPKTNIFISTILVLLISFVFQPLRSFFEKVTNGIFYRHHYDENRLLYDLTLTMSSSLRLNEMNGKLLKKIIGEMHISRGAIVLINHGRIFNLSHAGYKRPPKFSAEDLAELTGRREVVVFDELEESRLKRALRRLGIQVIVPLRTQKKRDNILILGEKLSGDPYTDQDIRLLEVFAPAAAVAISNTISVEQLIQLDELKSEFIAVASHQLRTPLSVARWNFELVLEGAFGHLSPKIRGIVSDTYRALMDLNQGLNNLMIALEIEERKVNMKYDQVDFNKDVLGEALASLKKEIVAKDIKISKKIIFKGLIRLDRHKMVETLKALITNSIEYSPAGSKVEIFVQAIEEDGRRKLFFSIKDQGIGVSLKNQAFIFKKFFRGEEAKELSPNGFGLSLFIARSFIEFHGGRIWLEKGDGKELGATFVFTLPL